MAHEELYQYYFCPAFPTHTPVTEKLNCNTNFDVTKQHDNFVFPLVQKNQSVPAQIENFQSCTCTNFFIKLIIFVAILWFIIYFLLRK